MSFIDQLTEKPWLRPEGTVHELHDGRAFALPTAKFGLRVFLVVVTVVFSALIVIYTARMDFPDWRPLPDPWLLWLNTAILISSSVALQWARVSARRNRVDGVWLGLIAGGVLAFAFLIGQLLVWQQLVGLGYFAATNPANGFFYLITGLHGVHMMGGLVAWGRTITKMRRNIELREVYLSVELCAIYWHYLLAVWLVLFGLLLLT